MVEQSCILSLKALDAVTELGFGVAWGWRELLKLLQQRVGDGVPDDTLVTGGGEWQALVQGYLTDKLLNVDLFFPELPYQGVPKLLLLDGSAWNESQEPAMRKKPHVPTFKTAKYHILQADVFDCHSCQPALAGF